MEYRTWACAIAMWLGAAGSVSAREKPVPLDGFEFPHEGFTVDAHLGAQGCIGAICRSDRLGAKPGLRVEGFVGGNIHGFVDLGIAAGWGMLTPNAAPGTNVLALYGVDVDALQAKIDESDQLGFELDFSSLDVERARLRTLQAGPRIRVHFIPRGRVALWIGSGVEYNRFRGDYETEQGSIRMDFHGLAVPVEAGLGVFVHENVAVVTHFNYRWTWYAVGVAQHRGETLPAPIELLEDVSQTEAEPIGESLPQLWSLSFGLRLRV